ncbi:universal stress protein, partial [Streptomyces sp. MK7]|uniref:universal stress protein n=1 Tax=Streptomyces sp. MK7 TaxID=3067635 RepID=UPI00292CD046
MSDPVIVGVQDGSASSLDAVVLAAREAQLRRVPLWIVHAFGRASMHPRPGAAPWSSAHFGLQPMAHGTLVRSEEQAHTAAPGIEVTRSVVTGGPRQVLESKSRQATLAVIGTRARS